MLFRCQHWSTDKIVNIMFGFSRKDRTNLARRKQSNKREEDREEAQAPMTPVTPRSENYLGNWRKKRPPPLVYRDSYSTITTTDDLDSPHSSLAFHSKPSPIVRVGQEYIPQVIWFCEEKEKAPSRRANMLVKDRWSSSQRTNFQSDLVDSPSSKKDSRSLLARHSQSQWKSEGNLYKDVSPRHRSGRPRLRKGISIGMDPLTPPLRSSKKFIGSCMEL